MQAPSLTLGIEEEYQIIDPKTRELKSYITQILEADHRFLEQVKPELHQSIVEVGTKVCRTPAEVRTELVRPARGGDGAGRRATGSRSPRPGTHPFSSWMKQEITPLERYLGVKEDMQDLAQRLLIFGTHVHIGIEDREFLIDAMNVSRYFLPHVLCLSTSSPFWMGRNTGLKSYRSIVFRGFPRTGMPRIVPNWAEYESYLETLTSHRLHPQRLQDLVGRPAELELPHARVPDLRRVHPGGRGGLHRRDLPGHRRQAVEAAARQHDLPGLPDRPDRGEQVAGGALRARRQADRLRQAAGAARAAT